MARIALYKEPEQLRSGNQYLQPAQFRLADSGVAQGLSKIAGVASNLSVKLMKQKQDLDDATTEIDLDKYLSNDSLERQKWFQENSGNDQIEKDGTNRWEQRARDDAARAIDYWANVPMSAETRLRVNARLANYSDKAITTAWGSSLQQRGQNFTSMLGSLREQAQQTGDFTQYNAALDTIQRTNVFSPEQTQGFKMDRDNLMTNVEVQKLNVETKDLVDTGLALGDSQYFREAQQKWQEGADKGLVKPEVAKSQINQIKYKAEYSERWQTWELDALERPGEMMQEMVNDDNVSRSGTSGANIPSIIETPASVRIDTDGISPPPFDDPHYQSQTSYKNPETGKYLDATTDAYVVVPLDSKIPLGTKVRVTNTENGQMVDAIVGDRGPTKNGYGELSLFAAKTLGAWEDGMGNAAKQVPLKYEFNSAPQGKFDWMTPNDKRKADMFLRKQIKTVGLAEFNELRDEIDFGTYAALTQDNELKFNEALDQSPNMTPSMKDTLTMYRAGKIQKSLTNNITIVADLKQQISDYASSVKRAEDGGQKYDADQLEFVMLGNQIGMLTDGFVQTELNQELRNVTENRTKREEYAKLSPALKLLRSTVLDYKQPEMSQPKETGMFWWKRTLPEAAAFTERDVIDENGVKRKVKTPLMKEMDETEKESRLRASAAIEENLREKLRANPNMTSKEMMDTLVSDPNYSLYRRQQASRTPQTSATTSQAGGAPAANPLPGIPNISSITQRVVGAKTSGELEAMRGEIYSSNDRNLINVYNQRMKVLSQQ